MAGRVIVVNEREACARYVERRAEAAVALASEGRITTEQAEHLGRVVRELANDLREGLHHV